MSTGKLAFVAVATLLSTMTLAGCKPDARKGQDASNAVSVPAGDAGKKTATRAEAAPDVPTSGKKVLMIIACEDFRDEELLEPEKTFVQAGHEVVVASTARKGCKGMMGAEVDPDALLSAVKAADFDAVVFVGGTGSTSLYDDAEALALAKDAAGAGKLVGAICLAPGILARAGVLSGRKVTSYDDEKARKAIEEGGGIWTGANVAVDGNIVTANGPEAAGQFGEKISQLLQ